jgi:choline dehydrogenase-like flavoprotein
VSSDHDVFSADAPSVITDPPEQIDCDIAIIGSGMGGATLAYALRETGARVLVLEQGGFLPRELANWSPRQVHINGRYKNSATWYDQDGNPFVPGNYHYVGGSTKLYGATLPRLREADFGAIEHHDGESPAWPITYDDLEPYYSEAEQLYWVHGDQADDPTEPWRSGNFPFPPVPHEPSIAEFASRLRKQGLHPFFLPQAIDLRSDGRCLRCKTCDSFPCMVDAKGDADVCAMRPALQSPTVRLLIRARVDALTTGPGGRHISDAVVAHDRGRVLVRAKRFALAAGAVNSAALLLRSRSSDHESGLANSSGQVGRNYMTHTTSFFLAVDPLHRNDVVYQKTIGLNDWYLAGPSNRYPLGNVQSLGKLQGPMVKNARRLVPLPILDEVTHRTLDLFIQTEDLPIAENRIQVDASNRIVVAREATNVAPHRELIRRMTRAVRRAGYPFVLQQALDVTATAHQCGTARMGRDGADSVVDPAGRAHDIENLWIVDSSVFPSSGAVNPALTVAALALRVAASGQIVA